MFGSNDCFSALSCNFFIREHFVVGPVSCWFDSDNYFANKTNANGMIKLINLRVISVSCNMMYSGHNMLAVVFARVYPQQAIPSNVMLQYVPSVENKNTRKKIYILKEARMNNRNKKENTRICGNGLKVRMSTVCTVRVRRSAGFIQN